MTEDTGRVILLRLSLFLSLVLLTSCQSASKKAEIELEKTLIRFSSLESRLEKSCLIESTLSAPTRAKYQQSHPDQAEAISLPKRFLWRVSHGRCEFTPLAKTLSPWEENHLMILKGAFCTLLMGFQIQSPLAGVDWIELEKEYREGVWSWSDPTPGIASLKLTPSPLKLVVTSEQGSRFTAEYDETSSFPKLLRIERISSQQTGLELSPIQFQNFSEGRVQSIFPREMERVEISIKDSRLNDFQYYGQAQILRCE